MNRQARGVKRVSIRLNPDTIREVDAAAKRDGVSRSGMVARLVHQGLVGGRSAQERCP